MASINAAHRLERAGLSRDAADAIVVEIEGMRDQLVTKTNLDDAMKLMDAKIERRFAENKNSLILWLIGIQAVVPALSDSLRGLVRFLSKS